MGSNLGEETETLNGAIFPTKKAISPLTFNPAPANFEPKIIFSYEKVICRVHDQLRWCQGHCYDESPIAEFSHVHFPIQIFSWRRDTSWTSTWNALMESSGKKKNVHLVGLSGQS